MKILLWALLCQSDAEIEKIKAALPESAPAKPKAPRKILFYSKTMGFRHGSIAVGAAAFKMMGEKTGAFTAEHTEDPAYFDEDKLGGFDAVWMLNTTGECLATGKKMSDEEKAAFERRKGNLLRFVREKGKGLAGNHAATDTFYGWPEYGLMIGAQFEAHPWGEALCKIDSPNHPLTAMFDPKGFDIKDEIYMFGPRGGKQTYSRENLRVLLSIDMTRFKGKPGTRADNDYAISWCHEVGKGRSFYCALGHGNQIYWNTTVLKHYLAGAQYILGDLEADPTPSAKAK